ncbi:MAG: DNA repair protein RecN [Clostridiales bacterium]|nr:DNA repair protein RecN [Clostridiales bacterium]
MLSFLEIQNVAIIDKISIEFGEGLNVMTGETGAGKSIIINSINAILGERISKDVIRAGEELAKVTAVFYTKSYKVKEMLKELDIPLEEDGTLIVMREIYLSGRNVCRINHKIVTLSVLKKIGEYIINIHGQNDNKDLIEAKRHIGLLDLFIGKKITSLRNEYQQKLCELKNEREALCVRVGKREERERKIDLLKYQLTEIEEANLMIGEDEELEKKRAIVANTEKIKMVLAMTNDVLCSDGGLRDLVKGMANNIGQIADLDEGYRKISEAVNSVSYQLDDVADDVRCRLEDLFFDENEQEMIDERIDLIVRLKRKYGSSIEDILNYMDECRKSLDELINSEEYIKKSQQEIEALNKELYRLSMDMHDIRFEYAKVLQERVTNELQDLEMRDSNFSVRVDVAKDMDEDGIYNFNSNGLDKVEFFISTNKGQKEKQLVKIASGGEMSRVMLAIKSIILDKDNLESIIFDEIDTGISGRAAQKVGEKLSVLSGMHQIICITHLSQIATMADNHYIIEKNSSKDETKTSVRKLSEDGRTREVARIIGGANISDITMKNAREMIKIANDWKRILQ